MKKRRNEKGSITLFVLIAMLFFTIYLVGMYILSTNSETSQIEEMAKIKEIYEQGVNNIDDVYATVEDRLNKEMLAQEIKLDGSWSSANKVNKPKLENTGLEPVVINSDGTTSKIDKTKEDWYSYDGANNKWANAKTEDGSMFVWIPRYAYKIKYNDESDKSQGGEIDVVFLQGTSNLDKNGQDVTSENYVNEAGETGAYIVHPAFEDGSSTGYPNGEWNKKIEGFWMAKFEAGYEEAEQATDSNVGYSTIMSWDGTNTADKAENYYGTREVGTKIKYPTYTANKPSFNYIGISDAYDLCQDMTATNAPYKLNENTVDSHLTKNSEWGAVAYLTHSKYGRNGQEITINNVSVNGEQTAYAITGYGGASVSAEEVTTNLTAIENNEVEGSWTTSQGQKASSTGNIYGIYDLSGGLWEWTAGYIAPESGNYQDYGGSLKGESNQYKSKYAGISATDTDNYNEIGNIGRKGEAIWETSTEGTEITSWNENFSNFVYSSQPFIARGADWIDSSSAGIFAFSRVNGYNVYFMGFRPILIIK